MNFSVLKKEYFVEAKEVPAFFERANEVYLPKKDSIVGRKIKMLDEK